MAYYNPYENLSVLQSGLKTGEDFVNESGVNMSVRQPTSADIIQPNQGRGQSWASRNNLSGGIIAGGAQLASTLTQPNTNPNNFIVDPYAGFTGSAQGLAGGGVIGAIVGGVGAQLSQFKNINENVKNVDTGVNAVGYDSNGAPVYQGSNIIAAKNTVGDLNKGIKKLNKTHLDPATNILSSLFGTRRKMKKKRGELQNSISESQAQFNREMLDFNNQQAATTQYNQLLNNQNRLRSLYNIGTTLY